MNTDDKPQVNPYAKARPTPITRGEETRPAKVPDRPGFMGYAMRMELTKQTRQAARAMRDLSNTYRTNSAVVSKQFPSVTHPVFQLPVAYSSSDTDSDDSDDEVEVVKTVKKKRSTRSSSSTKTKKRRVSTTPVKRSTTPMKRSATPMKRSTTPKRSVQFDAETPIKYTYPAQTQAPADTTQEDSDTDDDVVEVPALKPTPVKRTPAATRTPATTTTPRTPVELTLTCDITLGPFALATIAARVEEIFLRKMMSTLDQDDN
jgi:hypothetical protein